MAEKGQEKDRISPERAAEIEELEKMLDPKRGLDLQVIKTFDELEENFCIILMENVSNYNVVNTRVAKYFVDKGMKGVYVTINKGLDELADMFKAEEIAMDGILFIDAITKMSRGNEVAGNNYTYLDSPKDLLNLSVAIETAMAKLGSEKRFIIIDSLTTLLVYSKPGAVEKFVHMMAEKTKTGNAAGIFILMDSTEKNVTSTLAQFCDKVVELQVI